MDDKDDIQQMRKERRSRRDRKRDRAKQLPLPDADGAVVDLEDIQKLRKKRRRIRRGKRLLAFVAIVAVLIGVVAMVSRLVSLDIIGVVAENLRFTTGEFPQPLPSGQGLELIEVGNHLLVVTDMSYMLLRASGAEVKTEQHHYTNPAVAVGGGRFVIYDRGGRGVRVFNGATLVREFSTEQNIVTAAISAEGYVALVTDATRHLTALTVYDSTGENAVFEMYSSDWYISDVSIGPGSQDIAIVSVSAEGGELLSRVSVFSLGREQAVAEHTYPSELVLKAAHKKDGTIVIVGDRQAYALSRSGEPTQTIDYGSGQLAMFSNTDSYTVIASRESPYALRAQLTVIGADGATVSTIDVDGRIQSVACDSLVAVLTEALCAIYTPQGELYQMIELPREAMAVCLSGRALYVLTNTQVLQYELHEQEDAS